MSVLRVRGQGVINKPVDYVMIRFTVRSEDYDYQETLRKLNLKTRALREAVIKAGFKEDDLKTVSYSIQPRYQFQNGQNVFVGYQGIHELQLGFEFDRIRLNQLLKELANSKVDALFSLEFALEDKEAVRNLAIEKAVEDAISKAELLARSANVNKGKITNISYQPEAIVPFPRFRVEALSHAPTDGIDVTPADVREVAFVDVEFEIV